MRAKLSAAACLYSKPTAVGEITANARRERNVSSAIEGVATLKGRNTSDLRPRQELTGVGELTPGLSLLVAIPNHLKAEGNTQVSYTDKFAGSFNDYGCNQKLYPIKDIVTSHNGSYFVNKDLTSGNLYQSVDEGVFTGTYHVHGEQSTRTTDDRTTYIQPSAIYTEGDFRYKFEVTNPSVTAKSSRLFIRAAAPRANYASDIPPQYKIHNIKLEDPSGNLIIKYGDITLRGDADFNDNTYKNFATYGTSPTTNNLLLKTWDVNYPFMEEGSGYTLTMDFNIQCLDDPFNQGFDTGYEDTCVLDVSTADNDDYLAIDGAPLSTQIQNFSLNPTNSLRISAIEICNSGAINVFKDRYLNFYAEVQPTGVRLERCILPAEVMTYGFENGIYPAASSIWSSSPDPLGNTHYNTTASGSKALTGALGNDYNWSYISMDSTSPVADSGKLKLKFGHTKPNAVFAMRNGAFSIGVPRVGSFDTAFVDRVEPYDHFFVVDSVYLKVKARKDSGSRDYAIDVVGYSDDKLLNITPAVGGFLQNTTGDGTIPTSSGFNSTDELGIDGEAISDQQQYFETNLTNNSGGDHYKLSSPVVSGTSFEWYTIPLTVYPDTVALGKSRDYNISSYWENLYLDIYPLPSGATISTVQLCISYAPTNAMALYTIGDEKIGRLHKDRSEGKIYPSERQTLDSMLNTGPDFSPLSKIENIPHAYKTPITIKSNYSRRWRGMDGIVSGPFDPDVFGFGFENPLVESPFISGFYDFDNIDGTAVNSRVLGNTLGGIGGILTSSYSDYWFKNLGWRFTSGTLFSDKSPYTTDYQTTDWTSLEKEDDGGLSNLQDHELYGQISDAFNNVVRISGENSFINFGNIDTVSGFSIYTRFSPDVNISGWDGSYNLFNSGVIFSKWDSGKELEFALGYDQGYLCGYAKDIDDNIITVKDTLPYSGYQYPLSVILTYNDHLSSGLKLYTDNELHSGVFTTLRASSSPFYKKDGTSNLILGNSTGSGVGMNMFVSEFGISTYDTNPETSQTSGTNIVQSNPDLTYKQVTAQSFLEGHRAKFWASGEPYQNDSFKLWDYINEDTLDWDLGAFKFCEFSPDFDRFTRRVGRDLISFNINHDGSGYLDRANIQLPSTVGSGLAYHTQIENDFLRFNLTDASGKFYSNTPRITKDLPRGYDFAERAFVVESVIEHDTYNDITWDDGNVGPKLIVSLYTRNKDPQTFTKTNWGLINRSIHYLEPSGCWRRLDSTFDFNSLTDTSEQWAIFDKEQYLTEMNHKYFSKDIDDMFLQYDIAYPSGSPFESQVNIHSAHVRLEDAFVGATSLASGINLSTKGDKSAFEDLNLHMHAPITSLSSGLVLLSSGLAWSSAASGMTLLTSGSLPKLSTMNLHSISVGAVDSSWNPSGMFLYTSGQYRSFEQVNLFVKNTQESNVPSGGILNLNTHASVNDGGFGYMNLSVYNGDTTTSRFTLASGLGLATLASAKASSPFRSNYFNLHIKSPYTPSSNMNLILYGEEFRQIQVNSSLDLHTSNYPSQLIGGIDGTPSLCAPVVNWSNTNYGQPIEVDDNKYAFLDADDEIRGVDLICYGSCGTTGNAKCNEKEIYTHDTLWRPETCVEGGIFRALATYTNLEVSGFKTPVPYSGHFYGIRKYGGLCPSRPYKLTLRGSTGATKSIDLPREWEEWEYGTNDEINFSGYKIVGDYPYVDSGRNQNDLYGKSVSVSKDLMAVGAPYHTVIDENGVGLEKAGALFVYKRKPEPVGPDWPASGHKLFWDLEEKLTLPSGFVGDFYDKKAGTITFPGMPTIPNHEWQIGQEGREIGHSVDATVVSTGTPSLYEEDRRVIVAGGPGARWQRSFDEITTSGVNVGVMVFCDEFTYTPDKGDALKSLIDRWNFLYRYYADPAVDLNLKVVICQPTGIFTGSDEREVDVADFIYQHKISRNEGIPTEENTAQILSGIKHVFHEAFPYDESKIHNNIPPVFGFYVDDSRSLGRSALEPAVDQFVSYYRDYSFLSGVKDFYGVQDSGHMHEFIPSNGAAEDWLGMSETIVDSVLDTGRLIDEDAMRFVTSGLGLEFANPDATEFNVPPSSGGKVYVFEKESGVWSLIQEIGSPSASRYRIPARFGHSVSISDNSEIIAIGSPYIDEACQIYEYDPSKKKQVYNAVKPWLDSKSSEFPSTYYSDAIVRFNTYQDNYGSLEASKMVYAELSASGRWDIRRSNNISEYTKVYKYGYGDIGMIGTWQFIPNEFCPTSRLGYSTAVNESGTIVAFGAPTDSMNEWEDSNVYYKNSNYYDPNNENNLNGTLGDMGTFASYVNAGAVRVFEARQYHPHDQIVEFYKFGNKGHLRNLDKPEEYDYVKKAFSEVTVDANGVEVFDNSKFKRTQFSDLEIPKDAGLALIITPEVDAASDEIIENIKDWLALGDRNLVLVGDDPVWESNGMYKESNDIINKILSGVGSKMRLHPARNEYEALSSGCPDRVNTIRSFAPRGGTSHTIKTPSIKAYGVADIRISQPAFSEMTSPCNKDNRKCQMPLVDGGDLRAEWTETCTGPRGEVRYQMNWPFQYGTATLPPCNNVDAIAKNRQIQKPGEDPVPVMVAAEYLPGSVYYTPAQPARSGEFPIYNMTTIYRNSTYWEYAENAIDDVAFVWSEDDNINNGVSYNIGNSTSEGVFFDPDDFNGRDSVLQGKGTATAQDPVLETYKVGSPTWGLEEKYTNPNDSSKISSVFMLATTKPERERQLTAGYDYNISFYENLVSSDTCDTVRIAQLGGWTGRQAFASGDPESLLGNLFPMMGHYVTENVEGPLSSTYDVCWIANSSGVPTDAEAQNIKDWLGLGGKKLFITMGTDPESKEFNTIDNIFAPNASFSQYRYPSQAVARGVDLTCSKLGITSRPWFLNGKEKYADSLSDLPNTGLGNRIENREHKAFKGCEEKHEVKTLTFDRDIAPHVPHFIAIKPGSNVTNIVRFTADILDNRLKALADTWQIKTGITMVEFPVIPGSGYRLFMDYVSEMPTEMHKVDVMVKQVQTEPGPVRPYGYTAAGLNAFADSDARFDPPNNPVHDYDADTDERFVVDPGPITLKQPLESTQYGDIVHSKQYEFQIPSGQTSLEIFVDGNDLFLNESFEYAPKTVRILAISGCLLPIDEKISIETRKVKELAGYEWQKTQDAIPPQRIVIPETFRPIMTDNTKHCCPTCLTYTDPETGQVTVCSDQLIDDGPVVIAQETEGFSSFSAGHQRSKITLISDSSLLQGNCIAGADGIIDANVYSFIRSLYPYGNWTVDALSGGPFGDQLDGSLAVDGREPLQNKDGGRQFEHTVKLMSPERGSPQKYHNASGLVGLASNFDANGTRSGIPMSEFTDRESLYNPRFVGRPKNPTTRKKIKAEIKKFNSGAATWFGTTSKISGVKEGVMHADAKRHGGLPSVMRDGGKDYLDFDRWPSGYPGDLFGYSIDLHDGKLVVGSPFAAFNSGVATSWSSISGTPTNAPPSGLTLGQYGGAGAAYYFERTGKGSGLLGEYLPWEYKQKIRPDSINVGQDLTDQATSRQAYHLGDNNYEGSDLTNHTPTTDRFGYSVSIDADFAAVGAPGHDFESYHEHIYDRTVDGVPYSGAFIRKAFDFQFDIPLHNVYNLGESGLRNSMSASGVSVLNNGAVFTFEHKVVNWDKRLKKWVFAEKLVQQGYEARKQKDWVGSGPTAVSGSENDYFGEAVDIDRARRTDGDYTIAVGAPHHKFSASGNPAHSEVMLLDAGAAYTYDAMLRGQPPALGSPDSWLHARVFGLSGTPELTLFVDQNETGGPVLSQATGVLLSNEFGEIFIEGSGYDPVTKGFIEHRPYIDLVSGPQMYGTPVYGAFRLHSEGQAPVASSTMNLFTAGPASSKVYNSMGLYSPAVQGFASGVPSGMFLHTGRDPIQVLGVPSGLFLHCSGVGGSNSQLNLRIRGK